MELSLYWTIIIRYYKIFYKEYYFIKTHGISYFKDFIKGKLYDDEICRIIGADRFIAEVMTRLFPNET